MQGHTLILIITKGGIKTRRFNQLDSLRGVASILVFTSHISLVTAKPLLSGLFSYYLPFFMLFQGDAAVNSFFILSGFVLFLPYTYGYVCTYPIYITKRFFRVYAPYLAAIMLSIIACALFSRGGIVNLSSWFNDMWIKPIAINQIINHILLIGNFNSDVFNNVIWYLVQDMRISLIFPLMAMFIKRYNWKLSLLLGLCLSLINGLNILFNWELSNGYHTSFFYSLQFMNMFIIGSLLAKHLENLYSFYNKLSKNKKFLLLFSGFILLNYNQFATIIANYARVYYFGESASDYSVAIGFCIIILFALFSKKVQRLLSFKPALILGKISYSLYLYHLPVLFSLIYLLYDHLALWIIYLISIPTTLIISYSAWRYIEKSLIIAGKRIVIRISKKERQKRIIQKASGI